MSNENPKQALGLKNIPVDLFSPIAIAYGSIGKLNGKLKYGLSNFLGTDVIMSIYLAAIKRHVDGILAGEEYDPADGVPHFGAILANVDVLLCARAAGTLIDDRALIKGYREEIDKLLPIVESLQKLHADKNPEHHYLNSEENQKVQAPKTYVPAQPVGAYGNVGELSVLDRRLERIVMEAQSSVTENLVEKEDALSNIVADGYYSWELVFKDRDSMRITAKTAQDAVILANLDDSAKEQLDFVDKLS